MTPEYLSVERRRRITGGRADVRGGKFMGLSTHI